MEATDTTEKGFESLIVNWLVNHNGYEQGHSHDFNTEYALDTARLFRFLKNTQPDAVKKSNWKPTTKNGTVLAVSAMKHQAWHC